MNFADGWMMKPEPNSQFSDKTVAVVGATGGIGRAVVKAFIEASANVIILGRKSKKLLDLQTDYDNQMTWLEVDLLSIESITNLEKQLIDYPRDIDMMVNAVGVSIRKPLLDYETDEIQHSICLNLNGAILLTQMCIRIFQKQSSILLVHIGGYLDGRLGLPYHSVDVATRAGLFSFIEAVNREHHASNFRVQYFSPSAVNTETEQPFHPMWEALGIEIVSPEQVAVELLNAIKKEKQKYIMGGIQSQIAAALNAIAPKLADRLFLQHYHPVLRKHLDTAPSL